MLGLIHGAVVSENGYEDFTFQNPRHREMLSFMFTVLVCDYYQTPDAPAARSF